MKLRIENFVEDFVFILPVNRLGIAFCSLNEDIVSLPCRALDIDTARFASRSLDESGCAFVSLK